MLEEAVSSFQLLLVYARFLMHLARFSLVLPYSATLTCAMLELRYQAQPHFVSRRIFVYFFTIYRLVDREQGMFTCGRAISCCVVK